MTPPGPRTTRRIGAVGAALGLLFGLGGCTRPVAVVPPGNLTPAAAQACNELVGSLPANLEHVGARRETTPDSLVTAAWGEQPVALRCGVPKPAALEPTSVLVNVDGVDWFPEELSAGYLMTTVGRVADVELTVPSAHAPAPSIASELAPLIRAHDPLVKRNQKASPSPASP